MRVLASTQWVRHNKSDEYTFYSLSLSQAAHTQPPPVTHTHARTHALTHARTHTHTHTPLSAQSSVPTLRVKLYIITKVNTGHACLTVIYWPVKVTVDLHRYAHTQKLPIIKAIDVQYEHTGLNKHRRVHTEGMGKTPSHKSRKGVLAFKRPCSHTVNICSLYESQRSTGQRGETMGYDRKMNTVCLSPELSLHLCRCHCLLLSPPTSLSVYRHKIRLDFLT